MTETSTDLAAAIALRHRRVRRAVVARIWELFDGGLTTHEIASNLGVPLALVTLVVRGGNSTAPSGAVEKRAGLDRPTPPGCATPLKKAAR